MKVRVKDGKKGFIYGSLRHGATEDRKADEFTLKSFEHPRKEDENGDPLVVTVESQFSKVWMEEVDPKPKEVKEEIEQEADEELVAPKAAKKKAAKKTKE